jgi:hypothetical protein
MICSEHHIQYPKLHHEPNHISTLKSARACRQSEGAQDKTQDWPPTFYLGRYLSPCPGCGRREHVYPHQLTLLGRRLELASASLHSLSLVGEPRPFLLHRRHGWTISSSTPAAHHVGAPRRPSTGQEGRSGPEEARKKEGHNSGQNQAGLYQKDATHQKRCKHYIDQQKSKEKTKSNPHRQRITVVSGRIFLSLSNKSWERRERSTAIVIGEQEEESLDSSDSWPSAPL